MKRLLILAALSAWIFTACNSAADNDTTRIIDHSEYASSSPFLTKDNQGNIVISWVREISDSEAVMCYTIPDKNGLPAQIREISPSKGVHPQGENLPKLAFKSDGTVIAMWGILNPASKNKYAGKVMYSFSKDGKEWNAALPLVTDTDSYDQRYFDLKTLPDGQVAAIWLDSRMKTAAEGSTLFFAATDPGNQFTGERAIAKTCCPCCRTGLYIGRQGEIHAVFREIIQDSIRDMVHIISADKGKTFSEPLRISMDNWVINGCPHTGPTMTENKEGLHFAWYTLGNGNGVFYSNSADNGKHFSGKENVSDNSSARHPQIISMSDGAIAIVWDETEDKSRNNRIGLQLRTSRGAVIKSTFITDDKVSATFPVIISGDNHLFIAYTGKQGGKTGVFLKKEQ